VIDYSALDLVADNYFIVGERCRYCSSGCDDCQGTGWNMHDADLSHLLHSLAVAGALVAAARAGYSSGFVDGAHTLAASEHDLRNAQQRCIALERELADLRAQVVAALSSAGPEVGEDERAD
jgi:hypothetical protein